MNNKNIRWQQRFENFEKAFLFLKELVEKENYTTLEASGLVKAFEFTFELAWKTMKDYLEMLGIETKSPREVIKESFTAELISEGYEWLNMLEKRNELSHTYDEIEAEKAVKIIKENYFNHIEKIYTSLKEKK